MSETTDVVVIGAGVIGCAVAFELAGRGVRVTVVDPRAVAGGATQASAGILSPYIEGHGSAGLLELGIRGLGMYDDFVRRVQEGSGRAVPYGRVGTLEVALGDEPVDELRASAARHAARGVRHALLDSSGARREEPQLADGVAGALLVHDHAFVAPAAMTEALAAAAGRKGARFVTAKVEAVRPSGAGIRVEWGTSGVDAGTAVLAAGSWSGLIPLGDIAERPVRPVRGQLLHLAWPGTRLKHITWSTRCYMVPWPDGTVLLGATSEDAGFDERTTVAGVRDLLDAACDLVPPTWQAGVTSARVGLRPASPDELPIVGRSHRMRNLVYATAHYRNGILLAPLTASLVAALIVEGADDPAFELMRPGRYGDL